MPDHRRRSTRAREGSRAVSPDEATPPLELLFGTLLGLTILALAILALVAVVEVVTRLVSVEARARRARRRGRTDGTSPRVAGRL